MGIRRRGYVRALVAIGATVAAVGAAPASGYPRPGHVERVSLSSSGQEANAHSGYDPSPGGFGLSMTPDGRYVAFVSAATNLVDGGSAHHDDVYVRDLRTGRTRIASIASDGSFGVAPPKDSPVGCYGAAYPAISADGRYVAFTSCYLNLSGAGRDLNDGDDVFVHDMRTGGTTMVSVGSGGKQELGTAWQSSISADGHYVAFTSTDPGVLDGSPCPNALSAFGFGNALQCAYQVYVHDMSTKRTWRVSATESGAPGDSSSYAPSMSADGRYVAFTSNSTNLAANDTNRCLPASLGSCSDVYLHDLRTGRNELISVGLDGQAPPGPGTGGPVSGESGGGETGVAFYPTTISADDRYVVFGSNAANLVPSTPAGILHSVYVRDRRTARTERVSVDSSGTPVDAGGYAEYAAISANGRDVVIASNCTVHDLVTGATTPLPVCAKSGIIFPQLSSDGRYVAFASEGKDIVAGDRNGAIDVFVLDQGNPLGVARVSGSRVTGSNLLAASVTARPDLGDLYVRLDVRELPRVGLFGLDFSAAGHDYEVRAGAVGDQTAFGLFVRSAGGWRQIARLRGGYGTTGESVVVALPLADLGAGRHVGLTRVTRVTAFSATPNVECDVVGVLSC